MKLRKILAGLSAAAVAATMTVSAFATQPTDGLADGTAYLNLSDSSWGEIDAVYQNVEITGDGTYTVSMTAVEPTDLAEFGALEVINGEVVFGRTYVITVDSVKINGEEVKTGDSYTCSADGGAVVTRVNLYNAYNEPSDAVDDNGVADNRAADGDVLSKTARLFDIENNTGVETYEVTFTVSGLGEDDAAPVDAADDTVAATDAEPVDEADAAPAATDSKGSPDTGVEGIAAVAGIAVVAGAALAISKKRK